jgi:hypothetical protein
MGAFRIDALVAFRDGRRRMIVSRIIQERDICCEPCFDIKEKPLRSYAKGGVRPSEYFVGFAVTGGSTCDFARL